MSKQPKLIEKYVNRAIFMVDDYEDWDHNIYQAGRIFEENYGVVPNIMLANPATLKAIDLFMSKKLISEGKESEIKVIERFNCSRFSLQICIKYELANHQFEIIYDPDATFGVE